MDHTGICQSLEFVDEKEFFFSQGVLIGQTLYLSGAIGLDPQTGQFVGEGVEEQTRQVRGEFYEDFRHGFFFRF